MRHLLKFGFYVSLLLCFATAMLCVSSYFIGKSSTPPGPRIRILRISEGDDYLILRPGRLEHQIYTPYDPKWYMEGSTSLYTPAIVFLIIAIALAAVRKYLPTRFPLGSCGQCGYPLKGNVSGTCPECGTKVSATLHAWYRQ